jgi:hypothetical protein
MKARPETSPLPPRKVMQRRWRSILAAVISFALVLSFFHGWSFDGDDSTGAISIAQAAGDTTGKAPVHPVAIHSDHCLTHLSSVAAQETAVAIDCIAHRYRSAMPLTPEAADILSPFEPPRA